MRGLGVVLVLGVLVAMTAGARGAPGPVVEGRVEGPGGMPAAHVQVLGTFNFGRAQQTFSTVTGADGAFVVEPPASPPVTDAVQSVRIFAAARGFSQTAIVETPARGRPGYKPVVLHLRATVALDVTVVDPAGKPVRSATVTIAADSWSVEHAQKGIAQRVDAAGHVRFADLDDASELDLVIAAPGFVEVRLSRVDLETSPMQVTLEPGALLRARVVDRATGGPLAGCELATGSARVTTDANGRVDVAAPFGTVALWPLCAGYGMDYDHAPDGLQITHAAATAAAVHEVRARRNQTVTGTVVDRAGNPVAGATVTRSPLPAQPMRGMKQPWGDAAVTDAAGAFTFDHSSMDEFTIQVTSPSVGPPVHVTFAALRGPLRLPL